MNKNQWLAAGATAVLAIGIYLFAGTTKPKGAEMPGMQTAARETQPEYDFSAYLSKVNAALDKDTAALVNALQSAAKFSELAAVYHRKGESIAEAFYLEKSARAARDPKALLHAGELYSATAGISQNNDLTAFLKTKAVETLSTVVEWDSTNTDNRILLATAYLDQGSEPMKGVGMLLEIVRKDSNNADAQLMLGKFGLVSGQFQKAIARLEKVVYLRPRDQDALFLLATAYQENGEKQKALDALYKCEKLVTKPELKKEIQAFIADIKSRS